MHTHFLSLPLPPLLALSLCCSLYSHVHECSQSLGGTVLLSKTVCMCVYEYVYVCVCVCVCMRMCVFCDATTHTSPHLPQSMRFPYWFNPQTQDQLQSVFMSIVIWPELWGLISSQFHPVGPFISRPELIHQRPKARQEKPCEERGWIFLLMSEKVSGRARERQQAVSDFPHEKIYHHYKRDWSEGFTVVMQLECRLLFSPVLRSSLLHPPPARPNHPSKCPTHSSRQSKRRYCKWPQS